MRKGLQFHREVSLGGGLMRANVAVYGLNGIHHRDNRTRELAMSRDRGPLCKVKMVA